MGTDGAISEDGQILGSYLHGLFENAAACRALLRWAGMGEVGEEDYRARRESAIERLADVVERHLELPRLQQILGLKIDGGEL